jgi:hypothetical protein
LDKSGGGNHATQATLAQRPTYGINPIVGTRNVLLATDTLATQSRTVTAAIYTLSFTGTGTINLTGASTAGPLVGTGAGNRVSLTFTPTAASLTLTVTGSVTFAQLELGFTATPYQKVVTQYEVTEAGVQSVSYLSFDGVDDGMVTPTITPNINQVQVFFGIRRLSQAISACLCETSVLVSANIGSFRMFAPLPATFQFVSKGTGNGVSTVTNSAYNTPVTNIVTGLGDIGNDYVNLRINGIDNIGPPVDQGTVNFLAYPMYIGRRGGVSAPFNGRLYSMIVRLGINLTNGQVESTENWVNSKTGAY